MFLSLVDFANFATAAGVLIAAWQLYLGRKQAVTSFEDSLVREYRQLCARLPTKALLGESLTAAESNQYLDEMYHYFDLCNQQVFLRQVGRISNRTWKFWSDGIKSNLGRPAFAEAWSEIAARANGDFSELRSLVQPEELNGS